MKFAIMGAGGLGAYFGARLALAGHDVAFIARGAHLSAMREHGLRVLSELGDVHLDPVVATDDPKTIGPVDGVIFAVKLWDTEAGAEAARPLIGPQTAIVSFQNGVEKDEVLARVVGREHVLGGVAYIATKVSEPGVVEHTGRLVRAMLGELDGSRTERVVSFARVLADSGIDTEVSNDVRKATWEKFVFLTGVAGVTSLVRSDIGPIRENAESRALLEETMREVVEVGRAAGVNLDANFAEAQLRFCDTLPAQMRASMAVDLERGRRLELPWLNGAVTRLGRDLHVETPANSVITEALAIYANGVQA